jgi:hypothetical protein
MSSERLANLQKITKPIVDSLTFEVSKFALSMIINAADSATSPVKACGGACVDCSSLAGIIEIEDFRVCDELDKTGVKVYRFPDTTAFSRTSGVVDGGAFY